MKILPASLSGLWVVLKTGLAIAAMNPVEIRLIPANGLPAITQIGDSYSASYTFINNLPFPKSIRVKVTQVGSGFTFDDLCNQVTLAPKGQAGSSCTTNIAFQPTTLGLASASLTLAYDNNVIPLHPPGFNNLSTEVQGSLCGNEVYPSNTGVVVPAPIIDSNQVWSFVSAPQLHPMKVVVSPYNADLLDSGVILNAPYASSQQATYGQSGSLMTDNDGNPIWFRPLNSTSLMNTDFRVQSLYGAPVLTFWQGTLTTPPAYTNLPAGSAEPGACYYIMDNSYRVIKTVSAFNGFIPDLHEFLITPDNTLLFLATNLVPMDLRPYGGPVDGSIHNFSIQEVDLTTNQLLFFWNAIDHIPLSSSHLPAASAVQSNNVWDPYHLNSLGLILDDNEDILVSSRNTWTIYRLNKQTGAFKWQLSGDGSGDFSIPNPAAQFSWQHNAQYLSGNVISLFDDGCCANPSDVPPGTVPSHGLTLNLDLINKIAQLNTSWYHDPNLISSSQGNTQNLSNGNKFIGYGSSGYYSEFSGAGNTVNTPGVNMLYDAQMPGSNMSYRSYRMNWVGTPYYSPDIAIKKINTQTTVYASWNGSTETKSWNVYAGLDSLDLQWVTNVIKNGFETPVTLNATDSCFQVRAVNALDQEIGASKVMCMRS